MTPKHLVVAAWLIFYFYWVANAWSVKATAERQSFAGVIVSRIPTLAGGVLLFLPDPPLGLGRPAVARTALTDASGVVVCCLGLALAVWSRITLAGNWSSTVTLKKGHELVERGPYRLVRHPIYSAILLMAVGSAVTFDRIGCWLGVLLLFTGFWIKLRQEERLMALHFPSEYPGYMRRVRALVPYLFMWAVCTFALSPSRARSAEPAPPPPASGIPTTEERERLRQLAVEDHRRMMALLHLAEPGPLPAPADDPLRPADTHPAGLASSNWTDGVPGHTIVRSGWGSWTNYDLAKAERYPLPDALTLQDGGPVRDAGTWWAKRRPEILGYFTSEIYGVIPGRTPRVTWEVTQTVRDALDGTAVLKRITGRVDNSSYPEARPTINVALYIPNRATGPVPVMVVASPGTGARGPGAPELVIAHGWGYALVDTYSIQADSGGGLVVGIIGLCNQGKPRGSGQWGALAAWSWGLSRVIDYFETDRDVDSRRLGIEGHSRWGKEALLAAALDSRWAIVYSSCSGEGGAKLHRHDLGESVDNVCGPSEYHWMAGNFLGYAGHWDRLPVDQHELIALIAPRPVFIGCGTQDLWADPVGEFKACVAAGPVYRLVGARDLGVAELPAPDEEIITGDIGFRMHAGGHTDVPDWPAFLRFADRHFPAAKTRGESP